MYHANDEESTSSFYTYRGNKVLEIIWIIVMGSKFICARGLPGVPNIGLS